MADVDFQTQRVRILIDEHMQHSVEAIAFRIEERCKVNINETPGASGQGLIDTGFMLNTTYVVLPDQDSYDETWQSGEYEDRQGEVVPRAKGPKQDLDGAMAKVVVGANYAIDQEIKHKFLIKAAEDTANEVGGLVETF